MIRIKCALFMKSLYINGKGGSMNIMEDFLQDFEKLSNQKPRYFPNSKMHCLKQRYLAPLVFCEKITEATMNILMQEIQHQNNQPNINYLLEILVAKCLVQRKNADIVFEVLESDNNLKAPNLQSLFVVLFLFCEAMKRKKLGDRAIEAILPYTMGKNFGTRLYSQITALQLIETFDEGDMDLFHKIIKKSFKIGNAAKHYAKIQEDFRYSCMNYDRLLTIDMAYHHLPRIGGMSDDEIITYEMFQKAVQELAWIDPPDDPTNKTDQFFHNHYYKEKLEIWSKHLMPKDCSMEQVPVVADSKVENLIVSEELAINSVINGSGNGTNVQQKIMPYKFQMPNKSLLATISRAADLVRTFLVYIDQ